MNSIDAAVQQRVHTLDEIMSQPECWSQCLRQLDASSELRRAAEMAEPGAEWLFVGCGSSYYLALSAAATYNFMGLAARAIPASELLLFPNLVMPRGRKHLPVMISRSGLTSEVLRVARMLEAERGIRTIAITYADGQPLESISSVTLKLLAADEKSTVMTRSFTSMLVSLQYLAGTVARNESFCNALVTLPLEAAGLLREMPASLRDFVATLGFADYVFLGQGPLLGIASEAMLKVTESSCSYAQVFHTMEFRHGPKSMVGPETLVTFLMSETSYATELEVLEEMKQLGATTLVIGNALDTHARRAADFALEMALDVPEYARLAPLTIWGQLLGVYTGLNKGLNPDSPRNLSRVVVLDGSK